MITTGRQIAAARALLGWSQDELADAAAMHVNSVAYWERHVAIPTGYCKIPIACRRIKEALFRAGVEMFVDPSPGVRMIKGGRRALSEQHATRPRVSWRGFGNSPRLIMS